MDKPRWDTLIYSGRMAQTLETKIRVNITINVAPVRCEHLNAPNLGGYIDTYAGAPKQNQCTPQGSSHIRRRTC